ncbi:LacI family DNA-binding transcriptional regulator [Metabacillus sp. cB07]|uniref:LacI family DNA-binding transcriptional regulator n=1 Tax=Metabacillus sp. cB07 TaxID=2806989 RepID=UPI00193A2847|nr:LacI family DNA-binding transcriptional regulator [Metabacillus sp. cB07]
MNRLNEIAKLAGVSRQEAEDVLHEYESNVSEISRTKIMQAAESLQYRVPKLSSKPAEKEYSIALAVLDDSSDELENPFFAALRKYAEVYCLKQGIHIREIIRRENISDSKRMADVDGVLVIGRVQDGDSEAIEKVSRQSVVLTDWDGGAEGDVVSIDLHQMTELVISHLKEMGHEKIGYIGAPNWGETLKDELMKAGLLSEAHLYLTDPHGTEGYRIMKEASQSGSLADAYIVQSSVMSLAAITALREEGKRIPDEVSIVSFYDVPEAHYFAPSLTTLHVSAEEMAKAALSLLTDKMTNHRDTPLKMLVPATMKMRESTASK